MSGKPTILIVEDEAVISMMLQMEMEEAGYAVVGTASTGAAAVALQKATQPDLILMDIRLADKSSGLEAARQIRAGGRVPILFITGYDTTERTAEVESLKPSAILAKPLNMEELRLTIAALLRQGQ